MPRIPAWTAALLLAVALLAPARRASAQGYVIVVNEAGPASLRRDEVSRIFLGKSRSLTAVDQDKDTDVRTAFSRSVIGRPVAAVVSYWQQQIFSGGEAPPMEKRSDSAVLDYVRANPKAIGYVAAGSELGTGVRILALQ